MCAVWKCARACTALPGIFSKSSILVGNKVIFYQLSPLTLRVTANTRHTTQTISSLLCRRLYMIYTKNNTRSKTASLHNKKHITLSNCYAIITTTTKYKLYQIAGENTKYRHSLVAVSQWCSPRVQALARRILEGPGLGLEGPGLGLEGPGLDLGLANLVLTTSLE